MTEIIEFDGYKLTNDPQLLDKQNCITPENKEYLLKAYDLGMSGTKKDLTTIKNYIKKYPKVPNFKNYLASLYERTGDIDKAIDVCEYTYQQHPDYLLGRTNLVQIYFQKEKYEEMEDLLGKKMELRELFPEREIFHIDEYVAFQKAAALYFAGVYNLEEANARIQKIRDLDYDPDSADIADALIFKLNMSRNIFDIKDEDSTNKAEIEVISDKIEKLDSDYNFNFPEFAKLKFKDTLDIDYLREIKEMPKDKVIQDLKAIIDNAVQSHIYGNGFFSQAQGVLHATLIITELEETKCLTDILDIFRQDQDFIDEIFDDLITVYTWIIFYKLGQNQIDLLKEYMFEPNRHPFVKTEIARAMEQLAYYQPKRVNEVENWFKDVLEFFTKQEPDSNIIDTEMIGLIIAHVMDLRFNKLFPLIENLYQKGYAFPGVCGSLEEVKKKINSAPAPLKDRKEKILSVSQIYSELQEIYNDMYDEDFINESEQELELLEEFDEDFYDDFDEDYSPEFDRYINKPIVKEKKIGRNEPCPCGSGKKYKKCCLNK